MTVNTELCYIELNWTGVETSYTPGFQAADTSTVYCSWRDAAGNVGVLLAGTNYSVALDGSKFIAITPLVFPAAPKTIVIQRLTPGLVGADFSDNIVFPALVHQDLHDRAAMRDDEIKAALGRAVLGAGTLAPPGTPIVRMGQFRRAVASINPAPAGFVAGNILKNIGAPADPDDPLAIAWTCNPYVVQGDAVSAFVKGAFAYSDLQMTAIFVAASLMPG